MPHDLGGLDWKEGMGETCSYSFGALADPSVVANMKANGMTEADLSKMALHGEWGVIKGKMQAHEFNAGDLLFTGRIKSNGQLVRVFKHGSAVSKDIRFEFPGSAAKSFPLDYDYFESKYLDSVGYEWHLGKAAKKLDVSPTSTSVGALSDEDAAALFVKTKDALAKQKGILDLKGTNKALDDEVYAAIGDETGYTAAEVKAKVDAYKASGKKLSSLKKKVVKKDADVPHPNGVPIQPTKETVQDAVKAVSEKVEQSPAIAAKVYQDEDVVSAYIKAKDDLAADAANDWTLYTQNDVFDQAIFDLMRNKYGIELDDTAIKKSIANYTGNGNKISVLKKKLAKSKTDPWVPKADTLKKSKEASFHVTPPKAGEMPGYSPSTSVAGVPASQVSEFDILNIPDYDREAIYKLFKGKSGTYLTSSPESIYEAASQVAEAGGKYGLPKGDVLAVLKVVDERGAIKFGVQNERLFEKKLVEWLQTPAGKDYFQKKAEAEYWIKNQPKLPDDSALFQDISTTQAKAMQDEMGTLSSSEVDGLRTYTGGSYIDMNAALRKGRSVGASLQRAIDNAKKGMRRTTRNFLVHRGTGFSQFGVNGFEDLVKLVGADITDEGFVSTSVGGRAAFSGNPVLMEIEVPRGAKAAYVKPISLHPHENELILAPGTRFRILRVTKVGHQTVVRVRVLV